MLSKAWCASQNRLYTNHSLVDLQPVHVGCETPSPSPTGWLKLDSFQRSGMFGPKKLEASHDAAFGQVTAAAPFQAPLRWLLAARRALELLPARGLKAQCKALGPGPRWVRAKVVRNRWRGYRLIRSIGLKCDGFMKRTLHAQFGCAKMCQASQEAMDR